MPNFTPNHRLVKPLPTEYYNIEDFNSNADKIDTALQAGTNALNSRMPLDATPPLRNAITGDSSSAFRCYKMASISLPTAGQNATISMHVTQISDNGTRRGNGILRLDLRSGTPNIAEINWEYINELNPGDFHLLHNTTLPAAAELWVWNDRALQQYRFDVIAEGNRTGNTAPVWTLHNQAPAVQNLPQGLIRKESVRPVSPVETGRYLGDGLNRVINLGFRPKGVILNYLHQEIGPAIPAVIVNESANSDTVGITNNGFHVDAGMYNLFWHNYTYLAFR
jgi:hypothetical protein